MQDAGQWLGHRVRPPRSGLLEGRESLAALDLVLRGAAAGDGTALLVDAQAGLGKTTLLAHGVQLARDRGMRVLAAGADPLEQGLSWELAVQLFADVDAEDTVFEGAAGRVRALLDRRTVATTALVDPAPLLHGLFWLVSNLADQQPLLLVLDDLHWGDPETLRWLSYLVRRLDGLPLAVLMATRPWSPAGSEAERLMTHLAGLPATTRCHLPPLSDAGIGELLHSDLPGLAPGARHDIAEAVAGNPFLCRELAAAVRDDGTRSLSDGAAPMVDSRPGAGAVVGGLACLGGDVLAVATAIAVLAGGDHPAGGRAGRRRPRPGS